MKVLEPGYKWAHSLTPRSQTSHLIIHHCAGDGSPEAIHSYHRSLGWAGIAYHYYVRKDGSVYRGRPENMTGGHTTNWNYCSIGICFEGNFENETMGAAQKKSGTELVADIVSRFPSISVGRHSRFQSTSCPGRNFPFDEIVSGAEPQGDAEEKEGCDAWAKQACEWSVDAGLFAGDGKGNFRWRDSVSRQELAMILNRFGSMK